jgi:hypothetical protein
MLNYRSHRCNPSSENVSSLQRSAAERACEQPMQQDPEFNVYFRLILTWAMSYRRHPQITVWLQSLLN